MCGLCPASVRGLGSSIINSTDPTKPRQTHQFFKDHVFRDNESYERFPINSVFGTDWFGNTQALMSYVSDTRKL